MLGRLPLRATSWSYMSGQQCHIILRRQRQSKFRNLTTSVSSSQPSVSEFFKDRTVVVTGATGFVGQGLVEKLLRSCPDIGQIVVPIREHKNKSVAERFEEFLRQPVFREISRDNPRFGNKLVPVPMNLARADLGLTPDQHDYLSRSVSVILHSAANTKFHPPLSNSLRDNLLGTNNVMNFARQCPNLKSVVHVSTGFTNLNLPYIEEAVIPVDISLDKMLDFARNPNQELPVDSDLLGSHIVYVFSKRITEYLIKEKHNDLPVVICRPCMITPAISEPYPMWTHGHISFNSVMPSIADEMLPYFLGNPYVDAEQIPVDVVVNSILVSTWARGTRQPLNTPHSTPIVVNIHTSSRKPLTLQFFADVVNDYFENENSPFRFRILKNTLLFKVMYVCRSLPRCLTKDVKSTLAGRRAWKTKLLFMQMKQVVAFGKASFNITRREFRNIVQIESLLSENDRKDFNTDIRRIEWRQYISQWLDTCRRNRTRQ